MAKTDVDTWGFRTVPAIVGQRLSRGKKHSVIDYRNVLEDLVKTFPLTKERKASILKHQRPLGSADKQKTGHAIGEKLRRWGNAYRTFLMDRLEELEQMKIVAGGRPFYRQ